MYKKRRASKSRYSNSVSSKQHYSFDAKSSTFLDSFQEMFQPSTSSNPFWFRRDLLDSCLANCDEGSRDDTEIERLFSEARKKSETIPGGYENREQDAKSRVLSSLCGSYNYVTPSTICYLRGGDSQLLFPFSVYKPKARNRFVVRSDQHNGGISKEEFASTQSATGTVPSSEKQNKTVGDSNGEHCEKGNEFESDEPEKKRRLEWSAGNSDAKNMSNERAGYRERRERNNASAKKSRDARRVRELETQMKVAFLEKENMRLLAELMAVQQDNVCLRRVLRATF